MVSLTHRYWCASLAVASAACSDDSASNVASAGSESTAATASVSEADDGGDVATGAAPSSVAIQICGGTTSNAAAYWATEGAGFTRSWASSSRQPSSLTRVMLVAPSAWRRLSAVRTTSLRSRLRRY